MTIKDDKKREEQQAILNELESIKTLLGEEEGASKAQEDVIPDDIPLLQEMVVDDNFDKLIDEELIHDDLDLDFDLDFDSTNDSLESINDEQPSTTPGVLPGQQSLFDEKKSERSSSAAQENSIKPSQEKKVKASGENPFLPKHIRERLNGTVDLPAYDTAGRPLQKHYGDNPSSPKMTASATPKKVEDSTNPTDELVDKLVKEFMPKIEEKLRKELKKRIDKNK
jgi:hypothetical protein